MERTTLGRAVQFQDDRGGRHVGHVLCNCDGIELRWVRMLTTADIRLVRLNDTGELVLVDALRLEPNVPNPPLPAESQSWHDMMDELAKLPESDT